MLLRILTSCIAPAAVKPSVRRALLPACFGLQDSAVFTRLNQQLSCPLRLLPTLPPSVPGTRMQSRLQQRFIQSGGTWMPGDEVIRADVERGA
jgi:glycerol-3-phosphate dehydrogenase subunit B